MIREQLHRIVFQPAARSATCSEGSSILEAARRAAVPLASVCGGKGTCGKCKVKASGSLGPLTTQELGHLRPEEIQAGYRLACQAQVQGAVEVEVPFTADVAYKTALPLLLSGLEPQPNVRKLYLDLPQPSLEDQRPDLERLRAALDCPFETGSLYTLRQFPAVLRQAEWHVTAVLVGDHLAALEGGDSRDRCYGIAFDLGTTTVAAYLVDLNSGQLLSAAASTNRQTTYGTDVMTRIERAHAGGLVELRRAARETLNELILEVCRDAGASPRQVYEAVLAGNTCMAHLFLGIDPHSIGVAPYVPTLVEALDLPARELGLDMAEGGNVHLLPAVAGFVGADTVADLLAAAPADDSRVRLLIDLGTNAEMVLMGRGRMLACAAAAGPAFEGARISCGMRAAPGAIDRVEMVDGRVKVHTLDDRPALGLAGSGLISAVASLRREGFINRRGRLQGKAGAELFASGQWGPELLLASASESGSGRAIVLSQHDISELLLAKAAIEAGFKVLLQESGIAVQAIEEVLIAGAFGNYVDKLDAITVGLIPSLPAEQVKGVGNAAGAGAVLALLALEKRRRAQEIARQIEYVELSAHLGFHEEFIQAMSFPEIA